MLKLHTFGPVDPRGDALREMSAWLERLEGRAILGLLYAPHDAAAKPFLWKLKKRDMPVVGATSGGAVFTERGCQHHGLVAGVLTSEQMQVSAELVEQLDRGFAKPIASAAARLFEGRTARSSALVLCDGLVSGEAADGDRFMGAVCERLPSFSRVFGGRSGDHFALSRSAIFFDDRVLQQAAVLVRFEASFAVGAAHGFVPIDKELWRVTKCDGVTIDELGGRPAADVYAETLLQARLVESAAQVKDVLAKYPLGLTTPFGEGLVVRAVLALGDAGSMHLGGPVKEGDAVGICSASPRSMIESARELGSQIRGEVSGDAHGMLAFDCAGREQLLGDLFSKEARALAGEHGTPLLGMTCYGEFARFGRAMQRFHNNTSVLAAW